MRTTHLATLIGSALLVAGCAEDPNGLGWPDGTDPNNPNGPGGGGQPAPKCTDYGQQYLGFDAKDLTKDRVEEAVGIDRARFKPFSALETEYERVLPTRPQLLNGAGSTFATPPARWYDEPQATAIGIYTSYRIAFEGCLDITADAKYSAMPDANGASTECAAWARKFWSRDASPEEINACVQVATTDSVTETSLQGVTSNTTAERRWAYACASVLTAAGFLTY